MKNKAEQLKYDGKIHHIVYMDKYTKTAVEKVEEFGIDYKTANLP